MSLQGMAGGFPFFPLGSRLAGPLLPLCYSPVSRDLPDPLSEKYALYPFASCAYEESLSGRVPPD